MTMTTPTAHANQERRDAWVAALKSLVLPGLGQWHHGQFNRAAWFFSLFVLLSAPGLAFVALWVPSSALMPALLGWLLLTLGVWAAAMVDAWRGASRTSRRASSSATATDEPPVWRQRGVTLLLLLGMGGVLLPMLSWAVHTHAVASFRVPTASMAPTIWPGDVMFADRRYACVACRYPVRHGDVAVFANPNDRTLVYVKRIVALPGDRVHFEGGEAKVNGQLVPPAAGPMPPSTGVADPQGSVSAVQSTIDLVVPPGHVYVLGDNRAQSRDSRHFGPVPLADVVGRVRQLWWSSGADGVRWERLGRVVE